mmetsp:Transcript_9156/g.18406  ORF Transcript_9156/g.18406 Transcript_9156/m.18406 type:complete len:226 (+) Transcript_9156:1566-2243(+)
MMMMIMMWRMKRRRRRRFWLFMMPRIRRDLDGDDIVIGSYQEHWICLSLICISTMLLDQLQLIRPSITEKRIDHLLSFQMHQHLPPFQTQSDHLLDPFYRTLRWGHRLPSYQTRCHHHRSLPWLVLICQMPCRRKNHQTPAYLLVSPLLCQTLCRRSTCQTLLLFHHHRLQSLPLLVLCQMRFRHHHLQKLVCLLVNPSLVLCQTLLHHHRSTYRTHFLRHQSLP